MQSSLKRLIHRISYQTDYYPMIDIIKVIEK